MAKLGMMHPLRLLSFLRPTKTVWAEYRDRSLGGRRMASPRRGI